MLRAIGAFLVFLASAGMGCQESRKLSEHIQALEDYLQVIICLKGEIRYGGSSLPDAFCEAAMHCSERYAVFLKTVSEKMENRQEEDPGRIVRQCAMEYLRENALSAEEKERIAQLGERLGYLDREMQLRQLSLYESEFERMIQNAKEDGRGMEVTIIFKIAAVGILVSILSQVLKHSGRDEQAFMVSLAGLLIVLFWIVPYIYELFQSIQKLFVI